MLYPLVQYFLRKDCPLSQPHAAGRAGRPKDHAKHGAIVAAAKHLFASLPFDQVTMEAVAARAGVSKMTVYSHFQDKETLFEMIVAATSDQMIGALSAPDGSGTLEQRLNTMGVALLNVVLGSEFCTLAHTLPGTLRTNQPLATRFYAAGPGRVRAALAGVIKQAATSGELSVDDADHAAEDLISLWEGQMSARISFGLTQVASPAEVKRRTLRGTAVFLRAYRAEARERGHS